MEYEKTKVIMLINFYSKGFLSLHVSDLGVQALIKGLVELCKKYYGGYIKLEMSQPYPQRTLPQNSRYWAKCTEFGNYLGMTKKEVSEGVKFRAMEEGLWRGKEVPFSKTGLMMPDSSATADTKEMAILDEVLDRIAAEYGYIFDEYK